MILTAHQPLYLPWLGLLHKISLAEQFCLYDIVQYQIYDFNARNAIKTRQGRLLLSVPVESKNHFDKKLCDVRIINNGWNKKHLKSIQHAYHNAPFYSTYIGEIENILIEKKYNFLVDLNMDILKFLLQAFDIKVAICKASDYDFIGTKSELVLDMCIKLKAAKFIFGTEGKNYADVKSFSDHNIDIYFQDYKHPVYQQPYGEFLPNMSAIDLLFNAGHGSKEILLEGNLSSLH